MPSDVIEPSGETIIPDALPSAGATPPAPPRSSSSGDELTASLTHAKADPNLDPLQSGSSFEAIDAPPPPIAPEAESTADILSGLEISGSATAISKPAHPRHHPALVDDDGEDEPAAPKSWLLILLASYASAVTFGLAWVLLSGRKLVDSPSEPESPLAESTDPGVRAKHSRRLSPPKPIPAALTTTLGKPITVGAVEFTPLGLTSGPVVLERSLIQTETKPGGADALRLAIRLKNTSNDLVLAPFDEAFIRRRVHADLDSFIEVGPGTGTIDMFPLAVESEWKVVGQSFKDLRPGESFETIVVSVPDGAKQAAGIGGEMTWRLRLRTDLNHTEDVGIRFRASEIQPSP